MALGIGPPGLSPEFLKQIMATMPQVPGAPPLPVLGLPGGMPGMPNLGAAFGTGPSPGNGLPGFPMPPGMGLSSLPKASSSVPPPAGLPGMGPPLTGLPGFPGGLPGLPPFPMPGASAPAPGLPPAGMGAPPPGFGMNTSLADLANNKVQNTGATIADNEVKVQDPSGKVLAEYPRYAQFDDAPFPGVIRDALKKAGFPAPSQIQQYCWPLAMQQRDVIGVAATGSGKTISFLLPAFAYILERGGRPSSPLLCVLAPTRELAIQIQEESDKFAKPDVTTVCCYGGAPKGPQADALRRGVHGVIGTPGRVNDFVEGEQLDLGSICKLVLDEADRMLDMGFEPQIRKILAKMPRQKQTMFYTATWPASVRRLASEFLNQAYTVTIGNRDELKGNQDITQTLQTCRGNEKNNVVLHILKQAGVADPRNSAAKGLVFCSTKRMCDQLAQQIERSGVPCAAVHGDKGQRDREAALNGLKEGRLKLLVATDVAARGLDIKGVTMVINYDPPSNTEDYVHRIGRTGRAGQKGHAVALVSERDTHALRGIIQVMKRTNQTVTPEFEEMANNAPRPPPSGRAARGGPPPVSIDPNFKPGLSTGGLGDIPAGPPPDMGGNNGGGNNGGDNNNGGGGDNNNGGGRSWNNDSYGGGGGGGGRS